MRQIICQLQRSAHLTVEPCVLEWDESMERKTKERVIAGAQGGVKSAPVLGSLGGLANLTTWLECVLFI